MFERYLKTSWSNRCISCLKSKDFMANNNHIGTLVCADPESEMFQQTIEYPNTTTCECWRYMA